MDWHFGLWRRALLPGRRLVGMRSAALIATSLALAGCSLWGRNGDEPKTTAATAPTKPGEPEPIDVRRYIGPNYCPEIRVMKGAELLRTYEGGRDDDAAFVVWQGSIGKTARDCLYEQDGTLTLKVGISGRVIAGPKGGPATVTVPLKLVVAKYKEATLATDTSSIDVAIPGAGAAVFSQVRTVVVPSPGNSRDYVVYLGFDQGEWDLVSGEVAPKPVAVVKPKLPPPPPPPPKKAAPEPQTPNVLPTPSGGFVLPQ